MSRCSVCDATGDTHILCPACQLNYYCSEPCRICHGSYTENGLSPKCMGYSDLASLHDDVLVSIQSKDVAQFNAHLSGHSSVLVHEAFVRHFDFHMVSTAVQYFCHDILNCLIVENVDVSAANKKGLTPAHVAAQFNNIFALVRLHRAGADFLKTAEEGVTPVAVAACFGRIEALGCMVGLGLCVHSHAPGGMPPAYYATLNGHVPVLRYLRDQGVDLGKPLEGGMYLAHVAVSKCRISVLEFFRDGGYDICVVSDVGGVGRYRGLHAVYIAAEMGLLDVLRFLHSAGTSLDVPPVGGYSPAGVAARRGTRGCLSCLEYLIENGADVAKDCPITGFSPLLYSIIEGRADSLQLMLSLKPDLVNYCYNDRPLLLYAASMSVENVSVLRVLIDAGVDLTVDSSFGGSPLVMYKMNGFLECVKIYEEALQRGPEKVHVSKSDNATPFKACSSPGSISCANCGAPDFNDGGSTRLRTCSRCKLERYCGSICQSQHWKVGGHRELCIPVADRSSAACLRSCAKGDVLDGKSSQGVGDKCSICQESLDVGDTQVLACRHILHQQCALEFARRGAPRFCPICKTPF